jgi:hypothetical protein
MTARAWPILPVRPSLLAVSVLIIATLLYSSQLALAQFTQQGPKLVGTGAVGQSQQGHSVALSADGNTAMMGGYEDNSYTGATWVFTRSNGLWTQQGLKLVGTGAVGGAEQGFSVSLSGNGNTAIVGGPDDNGVAGAAWVFTRSGGIWTQQGSKLVGTAVGPSQQGQSVSLSSDGNTAIVGGPGDGVTGAAWVYTRSGGVWSQQGSKLVGTGAVGGANQGYSVALSADGNTAIVGGPNDNSGIGAAWVYTQSGGSWTQQGSKLVGTGAVGPNPNQGASVALSGDVNTAIVGGPNDSAGGEGLAPTCPPPISATHSARAILRRKVAWPRSKDDASLESGVPAEAPPAYDSRRDYHGRSHDCRCGRSHDYRRSGSHDYACGRGNNNSPVCPAASIRTAVKSNPAASFGLSTERCHGRAHHGASKSKNEHSRHRIISTF